MILKDRAAASLYIAILAEKTKFTKKTENHRTVADRRALWRCLGS